MLYRILLFSVKPQHESTILFWVFPHLGEGNGTPLQYSCLENPMGGGAWWAAVHGVAKSWTLLSDLTFTIHFHALEKEMATHSSVLAWRIPGMGEPGWLLSMRSHRVGHYWSDLAAAAFPHLTHQSSLFLAPILSLWMNTFTFHQSHPWRGPGLVATFYHVMGHWTQADIKTFMCMPSRFSCVWLVVTPWTVAHQAPLCVGFSTQEY